MRQLTQPELNDFITANDVRLHEMSLPQFRAWLESRIQEASRRDMFRQRQLIRDIKRDHRRRLRDRERRLEAAREAYAASPRSKQYERLQDEADGLGKAVAGLTEAVAAGRADPNKLQEFQQQLEVVTEQIRNFANDFAEQQGLERAKKSMTKLRDEIGLTDAEEQLEEIGSARGASSTGAGSRFETISSKATYNLIVPSLELGDQRTAVLHGATLGCARGEIDQIVVSHLDAEVVRVEAVVEAKRNINDIAHGFRLRQENLAWFVNDQTGYDPALYRTDRFPEGIFDGGVVHQEEDQEYRFDRTSFERFAKKDGAGHRLQRLYFVTEPRPLLGTTTAELGRILHRVATDPKFKIESDSNLKRFRDWALEFVSKFQSLDVLELYASSGLAGHVIVVG